MNNKFNNNDDDYSQVLKFATEYNNIPYFRFDACTVNKVNLFAIRENFDFDSLDTILDHIINTLPAIKRIFAKPITRLEDISEIMPVESVKVVNNRTIIHASGHSELWDDITTDGLKPKKLLTVSHEDSYAIYENIAFVRAVDIIRSIVSKNIRIIRDMMYDHKDMHFNLLERENHLMHFLAVGKLHIGYVRDYEKYRPKAEKCLDKLMFIDNTIRSRLGTNIYKKCRGYSASFTLKKTNIFRNHKDYYKIYTLLRSFSEMKLWDIEVVSNDFSSSPEGYSVFTTLISVFSAGHFNFTFDETPIDFFNTDISCKFGDWKLNINTIKIEGMSAIRFVMYKDKPYTIILLPAIDENRANTVLGSIKSKYSANEYLLALPDGKDGEHVYISLFDVESFRRIQQLLLRGMVHSDSRRNICPFCGATLELSKWDDSSMYQCKVCRTNIINRICPNTKAVYTTTNINNFRTDRNTLDKVVLRDRQLYSRHLEAALHFRNILKINEMGKELCPHCGDVH